jgi:hypothetical protein
VPDVQVKFTVRVVSVDPAVGAVNTALVSEQDVHEVKVTSGAARHTPPICVHNRT